MDLGMATSIKILAATVIAYNDVDFFLKKIEDTQMICFLDVLKPPQRKV